MATEFQDGNIQSEGIARLVTEAKEYGHSVTHNRNRTMTRFSVGMQLDATTDPKDPSALTMVTMHNVSESGIAFWSRKEMEIRNEIWIRESTEHETAPWISAYVTHCTAGLRGHLVGARFNNAD